MDIRNAKSAHFWQVDHQVRRIAKTAGVEVLSSSETWERRFWTRKYFDQKPKEGYFIWVKRQMDNPLFSCVSIASEGVQQDLENLTVVENGLKIRFFGTCSALGKNLGGIHRAKGRVVLKKGASLEYQQAHFWGKRDSVEIDYKFLLDEGAKLNYSYRTEAVLKLLKLKKEVELKKRAMAQLTVLADLKKTEADLRDAVVFEGEGSQGVVKVRLVGREGSQIKAHSQMIAKARGKGHLDCAGLMLSETTEIKLVPELICKEQEAQLTHEASIGKVAEEQLNYLRMRGLSEAEAINLIVGGFLKR